MSSSSSILFKSYLLYLYILIILCLNSFCIYSSYLIIVLVARHIMVKADRVCDNIDIDIEYLFSIGTSTGRYFQIVSIAE